MKFQSGLAGWKNKKNKNKKKRTVKNHHFPSLSYVPQENILAGRQQSKWTRMFSLNWAQVVTKAAVQTLLGMSGGFQSSCNNRRRVERDWAQIQGVSPTAEGGREWNEPHCHRCKRPGKPVSLYLGLLPLLPRLQKVDLSSCSASWEITTQTHTPLSPASCFSPLDSSLLLHTMNTIIPEVLFVCLFCSAEQRMGLAVCFGGAFLPYCGEDSCLGKAGWNGTSLKDSVGRIKIPEAKPIGKQLPDSGQGIE